jgi:hypothetical protein
MEEGWKRKKGGWVGVQSWVSWVGGPAALPLSRICFDQRPIFFIYFVTKINCQSKAK